MNVNWLLIKSVSELAELPQHERQLVLRRWSRRKLPFRRIIRDPLFWLYCGLIVPVIWGRNKVIVGHLPDDTPVGAMGHVAISAVFILIILICGLLVDQKMRFPYLREEIDQVKKRRGESTDP